MAVDKDRAVLVRFSDRVWMGGMVDKKAGEAVRTSFSVKAANVGHYWKRLIPKAAVRPRANAGNAARAFHMANTLPWMEGGIRILPATNFDEYMAGMRKLIQKAEVEEKKLIKEYPTWIDEAKRTHGKLFNADHFPSAGELRDKFGISIDVMPIPNVADWRVELGEEQVKELRAQAEAKFAAVQAEGIAELYERLQDVLEHAKERLSAGDAVFRNTLVTNIKDLCKVIGRMNVTGDKNLEAIRKETEAKLAGLTPDVLRADPGLRSKAAKDAAEIMKKMGAFMGKAPAKK